MTVSHVWRCESTNPGMTMQSCASTISASPTSSDGADRRDRVVLDQDVSAEDVSDLGIHAEDVAAAEQNALRHRNSFPRQNH